MGSRSRIFAPKTHLPLNHPPAPQPETMADGDVSACFDAGNSFNTKLKDALSGLVKANNDRKSEIDALRGDHDQLKKDHDALEVTTTRENDLRKNEIKSLEEKQTKDNTARQMDIAKLDGKLDTENGARKAEIAALDSWAKGENDARKTAIANLDNFAKSENAFLKSLNGKTLGISFNAYRTKAYDGGGEENLTFQGTYCNNGGGLDIDTGIFTCPCGGTYMFQFHIATHDNKKALLSIRKNGEEIASIFDQNHKDNHKNSMAGQNIIIDVKRGDEIVVYAYTGTWLADFPMNHYTHWVGLLLKPSQEELDLMRKEAEESIA